MSAKPRPHPHFVYITAGGSVFHQTPDCPALEDGRNKVLDRGGNLSPVRTVPKELAVEEGRTLCRTCKRMMR